MANCPWITYLISVSHFVLRLYVEEASPSITQEDTTSNFTISKTIVFNTIVAGSQPWKPLYSILKHKQPH